MPSNQIKSICVLGGGTAGFAAAAVLSKYRELSGNEFDITVVYSSAIGNIGVGESTLLSINDLFRYLGLTDQDWMKRCNATYKTSIAFQDFYKLDTQFQYPFGAYHPTYPGHGSGWFELKDHFPEVFTNDTFARYLLPWTRFNDANRLAESCEMPNYHFDSLSAYHFDTHLLAKVLKNFCEDRGVNFVDDTYISSSLNDDGSIAALNCANNTIAADLFIDCSGFKSLLLEQQMGSKFIDYGSTLINHRVVRAKLPYTNKKKQLKNYTNCVALANGWCWEIPLWDCLSVGYVHSLRFATEEQIVKEFKQHCLKHDINIKDEDISVINYRTGRHEYGWVKNVVGIGLSYGFLEPLESTGILTLLHNAFRLLEVLSKRGMSCTSFDRNVFNHSVAKEIDVLRGFIEVHYALSLRDDSDYWRFVTNEAPYSKDANTSYGQILDQTTGSRNYIAEHSVGNGCAFVLAGMGYSPYSSAYNTLMPPSQVLTQLKDSFLREDEFWNSIVAMCPTTYEFLQDRIYSPED